jgi:hypothetical protein
LTSDAAGKVLVPVVFACYWAAMVALSIETIAIALADEGVPLRAIARVTRIPSADLRERLRDAKDVGDLVTLPREDWPPGYPRDQRAIAPSRLATRKRPELEVIVQKLFGLSPAGTRLLLMLLQREHIDKNAVHEMNASAVDVHIHHLRRRLKPHGVAIETLWGCGYKLEGTSRRKAMDLVLAAAG